MSNEILKNLRSEIFEIEESIDDIDRFFQNSNSALFLDELKKIEKIITAARYDLSHIKDNLSEK